jgi:CBS-domain-containing membrane protein
MFMRADQIMSRQVITIGVDAAIVDAITTMLKDGVSALPVVDAAGRLVGILSKSDFLRRAEIGTERKRGRLLTFLAGPDRVAFDFRREHGRKVGEVMTPDPVTITADTTVETIAGIMEARRVRRLPVLDGDRIVGIVTHSDLLPAIARLALDAQGSAQDDEQVRSAVVASMTGTPWTPSGLNVSVSDGIVTLRGFSMSENARQAAIVAAENVPGVKRVENRLCSMADHLAAEEDGDFVSPPAQVSTTDDVPL